MPQGDCRAHPPVIVVNDGRTGELWPTTKAEDWCGEWQEKPEDEAEHLAAGIQAFVPSDDTEV